MQNLNKKTWDSVEKSLASEIISRREKISRMKSALILFLVALVIIIPARSIVKNKN